MVNLIYAVSILCAVAAPAVVYLLVRSTVSRPLLWALAGLAAHLVVGSVSNRAVMPIVWPMPTGTKGIPGPGQYQHGSFAELKARERWIGNTTLVSMGFGVAAAAALGLLVRLAARRKTRKHAPRRQLVGMPCAVCGKTIFIEPDGTWCSECGVALHLDCAFSHTCSISSEKGEPEPG